MNSSEDNQARRFLYLKRLYDKGADELHPCVILEVGRELGWEDTITDNVENWLEAEGLVHYPAYGEICISHRGQIKVENNLVSNRDSAIDTTPSPHLSGTFYLVAMTLSVLFPLVVYLITRSLFTTGFILFSALLIFLLIGAFQLRNEKSLSEKNFLQLIELVINQIPALVKRKCPK